MPDGTSQRIYSTVLLGSPVAGGGPQVTGTLYNWLFSGSVSALLHGNAWGLITNRGRITGADGIGLPTGIAWLPADRVSVQDDEQQPENPLRARIYYMGKLMNRADLIHMPAFTIPGRVEGISPLRMFAMLWAQGLDALKYSADWFANGGFPPGTFQNISEDVNEQQSREIRRRLTDAIRQRQPLVYGREWEYHPIVVPQDEATMIQAMQLNATQVAAIYGVQPYRVGGTRNDGMTYSNVTMNLLDELTTTLRPWLTRWEHLLTSLLPSTQYVKFDVDEMLRLDPRARNEIYQIQRTLGSRTVNEVRAEDDKPPLLGGDEPIPLPVLERMLATTRSIPNSYLNQVVLEAELIAKMIKQYQDTEPELFNPMTTDRPPLKATAPQYLANLITQVRAGPLFGPPDAPVEDSDRKSAITMIQAHERLGHITQDEAAAKINAIGEAKTTGELAAVFKDLPRMGEGMAEAAGVPVARRELFGPGDYRASNRDRDKARGMLARHAAEGRLRDTEKDTRIRKASEAVFNRDLDTLFADLPELDESVEYREQEEDTGTPQPLFGPAALALLHGRAEQVELAARAAKNGKGGH